MGEFVLPGAQPFSLHVPPSGERQATPEALSLQTLEHGAYYAGRLGDAPLVARWHAKKRRFVFREFSLGRQRVRSVAHITDTARREFFVPLSKTKPKSNCEVSDYAFETAG